MRDRILRYYNHIKGCDNLINPMVDFRIQMVRTTGENDGFHFVFSCVLQGIFSFFLNVILKMFHLRAPALYSVLYL